MEAIGKAVATFLTRDIIYIIGGSLVVATLAYLFPTMATQVASHCGFLQSHPPVAYFVLAGPAYVLGYLCQDVLSLTPLVTTRPYCNPGAIMRCLYARFEHIPWQITVATNLEFLDIQLAIDTAAHLPDGARAQLERLITLKHIGTTVGSCLFACFIMLLLARVVSCDGSVGLMLLTAVSSGMLLVGARIKQLQQARYMADLFGYLRATTSDRLQWA